MITHFDRPTLRMLNAEIEAALQSVADKHGISIKTGGASFTAQNYRLKLEVAIKDGNGDALTKQATDFQKHATQFGLSPDDFGREFVNRRSTFKIVGIAIGSWRYPILCENQNGKVYKFPAATVKAALSMQGRAKALARGPDTEIQTIGQDDIGELTPEQLNDLIDGE